MSPEVSGCFRDGPAEDGPAGGRGSEQILRLFGFLLGLSRGIVADVEGSGPPQFSGDINCPTMGGQSTHNQIPAKHTAQARIVHMATKDSKEKEH